MFFVFIAISNSSSLYIDYIVNVLFIFCRYKMKLFIVMVSLFHVVKSQGKYAYKYICSVCGLQYVGESKQPFHKRLNGHRSALPKRHFFLWASNPDCLTTVSRIWTRWKSSSLNIALSGVIFNVRIGKDFGLKNSVFYIRTVLTEHNNRLMYIFFHSVYS
jgi:hypothetical protein